MSNPISWYGKQSTVVKVLLAVVAFVLVMHLVRRGGFSWGPQ